MDDDYFELTLSDRELCELEYNKQEWREEFGDHLGPVPTDPHDELFDVSEQPWQRREE